MEELLSVLKDVGPTVKSLFTEILPQILALTKRVLPNLMESIGREYPIIPAVIIGLAVIILFILFILIKPRKD